LALRENTAAHLPPIHSSLAFGNRSPWHLGNARRSKMTQRIISDFLGCVAKLRHHILV
jgi:hypothetical protein